ncbi:MAG TPA: type II secretion system protein GspM [Thermodesulfovibrionales bacterium]|nr:type II secretion system protein GspM [Thermodesulfovibrionales bacterium]
MGKNRALRFGIPLIILLVVLLGYQYGYVRVRTEMASLKESRAVKVKTLEKFMALIAEKPEMEKKLAALKEARKADDSKLIEGQTPSIAAAALQDTVKGILTGRGGTISSERVSKPEELGKFKIINISIDAVVPDARALSDILYSIETRTPYLVVKELDARIRNFKEPKDLTIKLDVSALTGGK